MKIYGPYTATGKKNKGRLILILRENNKNKTISYPKWIMEQHLGRKLTKEETVDHIDKNFLNNDITNLQILTQSNHSKKDAKKVQKIKITCCWCKIETEKTARHLHHNANLKKAGPFCSKQCAGKYGAAVQNKKIEKLPTQPQVRVEDRTYYY